MRPLFKVIEKHKPTFDYAVLGYPGEEILLGKEDIEMPGWFWCKNSEGQEAWIPKTHILIHGETASFNQPYNSIELYVEKGEIVQYLGESLGWIECLDSKWKYGWIPSAKLSKI
jgi:hypothetical protein